jgi:hypothetical protein
MLWQRYRLPAAFLAVAVAASIQTHTSSPSSQSAYSPATVPYSGCEDLPIPPTPDRPFRAELNAFRVENRPDGSTVISESHCIVGRDSDGRTLWVTLPSPVVLLDGAIAHVSGPTVVLDPLTRSEWRWDDRTQVARQLRADGSRLNVSTTFNARCGPDPYVTIPSLLSARRFESLGEQLVQGVLASGCRVTTVPGTTPQSEAYVYESWASSELGVEVHRRRRDGRAGYDETMSLDNLHREAPNAELFQPPAGYPVRRLNEALQDAEQARPQIPRPVSLAGRWETDVDASVIVDGLLLTLLTDVSEGINRLMSLTIGVYRREAGEESLGYFIANEGPVTWDGERLRIRFDPGRTSSSVDIDLTFDEPRARWTGTFGRNRDVRTVELRRPGAFSRLPATNRLVGDWCGPRSSIAPASQGCIRLAQGSDGVLLELLL